MMNLDFSISGSDLAEQIAEQSRNAEIVQLIKTVDQNVGDWDLTRELRDYFVNEMAKAEE